jgi:hypothetical protein
MRSIVLFLAVALVGCGASDTCAQNPASCEDAGQGTCTGQCAQATLNPFISLVWSGPAGSTPPPCPPVTMPGASDSGFLDTPPSKVTCSPACACSPSENLCGLPITMTASTATCPAEGALPFDAPTVWDGTCSTMDPVASAHSLTVDPPGVGSQGACAAATPSVATIEGGKTIAITCQGINTPDGILPGVCPNVADSCTYPNVPGFSVCIANAEAPCPTGWPVQHTFYQPACACACGPVMGDVCSTTVTAYEDSACSTEVGSITVTSNDGPTCGNISPAGPLGSKKATATYTPGTCAATLTPIASETLCCLK